MPTEDKRRGKLLPSPVVPADTVCFTIQIPNAVQYRAAFLGQLDVLGDWHTWDHPIDGTECIDCETAAQLWRNALYNATWSDECGGVPMACEDVADCIETNEAVQEAIDEHVTQSQELLDWLQSNGTVTTVSPSQLATNFGDVEECDPDKLFNVCTVAVETLHSVTTDLLELIALGGTSLERAKILVSAIPFVGDVLPFPEIIEAAQNIVTSLKTTYEAEYGITIENDIRCGLFCAAKPTCQMTIADMIAWYEQALGHSLPQNIVEAGQDILDYVWLGSLSGDTVVYGFHLLVLALVRVAQKVAGIEFADFALELVAAADEGNNDWETLCEECADQIVLANAFPGIEPTYTYIGQETVNGHLCEVWDMETYNLGGTIFINPSVFDPPGEPCFHVESLTSPIAPGSHSSLDCASVIRGDIPIVGNEWKRLGVLYPSMTTVRIKFWLVP